jgi:hypothetical protein
MAGIEGIPRKVQGAGVKPGEKLEEIDQWLFEEFTTLEWVSDLFPPNGVATVEMTKDFRMMSPSISDTAVENYRFLIERVKQLTEALEKVCAPEPDGLGGFVADEFTPQAILEARQALESQPPTDKRGGDE